MPIDDMLLLTTAYFCFCSLFVSRVDILKGTFKIVTVKY